jgi:hypothetical protein
MSDRDPAERGRARNGPGQFNLEGIPETGPSQPRQQVMEEAAALARAHYEVEPGLRAIYRLEGPDPNDLRIKLLEVNEHTVATGIVPVGFPPHPASGLHYPSVVIEVTPQEYEAIQHDRLPLPDGWVIRDAYERPVGPGCAGGTS